MICFNVCTFHLCAQSGLMHIPLLFFCVRLLSSLACTTLLTFVVSVVQLEEFQSHEIIVSIWSHNLFNSAADTPQYPRLALVGCIRMGMTV